MTESNQLTTLAVSPRVKSIPEQAAHLDQALTRAAIRSITEALRGKCLNIVFVVKENPLGLSYGDLNDGKVMCRNLHLRTGLYKLLNAGLIECAPNGVFTLTKICWRLLKLLEDASKQPIRTVKLAPREFFPMRGGKRRYIIPLADCVNCEIILVGTSKIKEHKVLNHEVKMIWKKTERTIRARNPAFPAMRNVRLVPRK